MKHIIRLLLALPQHLEVQPPNRRTSGMFRSEQELILAEAPRLFLPEMLELPVLVPRRSLSRAMLRDSGQALALESAKSPLRRYRSEFPDFQWAYRHCHRRRYQFLAHQHLQWLALRVLLFRLLLFAHRLVVTLLARAAAKQLL